MIGEVMAVAISAVLLILLGIVVMLVKCYRKIDQGKAILRNGLGGTKVTFSGILVIPVLHRFEVMDLSVKRVVISRVGQDGLICKDNMRADIKVAFFVRVNKTPEDVMKVAQSLGTKRASEQQALIELFDAKFSEALKTVGKQFEFVELYESRVKFKEEILQIIGTDLNGYILDDCAIDYLEQTGLENLNPDNILDAEGIKKITELTAAQAILSNNIDRDKEKTIRRQDVEAQEAILELNRQLEEAEAKQQREIQSIKAREHAEAQKVLQAEKLKAEQARIQTDEEVQVAEENKDRQIIVARKGKERTEAIESERVEKDRLLEVNERERIVSLAQIEKDRAIEEEKKNIQDVIRERVAVEREVVEEEERIKDTKVHAEAERTKVVALTHASAEAEEQLLREVKKSEADKKSAELHAEQKLIEADAHLAASTKQSEAMKMLAEARAVEEATIGMSEVKVMEAKAQAIEKHGAAEANVIQKKSEAEAAGVQAHAIALGKQGQIEAEVLEKKYNSEAKGIREKAEAMKALDGVGKEHEEFKLKLNKEKEVELKGIDIQKDIAASQAKVISEALKSAKIDIVGGDGAFFDQISKAVSNGKSIDRTVDHSHVLSNLNETFLKGDSAEVIGKIKGFIRKFGIATEDIRDLSMAGLMLKLMQKADQDKDVGTLKSIFSELVKMGVDKSQVESLLG